MVIDAPPFDVPLAQLRQRTSEKWFRADPDVLPLWVAEMDVMQAPAVVEAVEAALVRGDTGYATGAGYAEAYAAFAEDRWTCTGFDPARSALVPDVMLGVVEMLKLVTGPGDPVVLTPPVYPPFYSFVEHLDRRVVEVALTSQQRLDISALRDTFASLRGRRAVLLLCSPHNPTGTVHTADELAALAAAAESAGVRVVVDEIHAPLVLPGATFTPYFTVPGSDRALVLVSASKGWNLPGLKSAVAFAGAAAAGDLAQLPEEVGHGPSHLAVLAHTAALRDGRDWLDQVLRGLDRNRRLLSDLRARQLPAVRWQPGEATYLAWFDFAQMHQVAHIAGDADGTRGDASARTGVAAWLLERAKVLLSSGPSFGAGGDGCARLNFATSASVLTEAIQRMADAVAQAE